MIHYVFLSDINECSDNSTNGSGAGSTEGSQNACSQICNCQKNHLHISDKLRVKYLLINHPPSLIINYATNFFLRALCALLLSLLCLTSTQLCMEETPYKFEDEDLPVLVFYRMYSNERGR